MESTWRWRSLLLASVMVSLVGLSCGRPVQQVPRPPSSPTSDLTAAQHTLIAWLECEECIDGELEAVVTLGRGSMHDQVLEILAAALQDGPAAASWEVEKHALEKRHGSLLEYAKAHPESSPPSEKEFVDRYLGNYRATYQLRAARALAEIAGSAAYDALQKAAKGEGVRPDVKRVLDQLIRSFSQQRSP